MFEVAIKELLDSGAYVGIPESFNSYKARTGLSSKNIRTASVLSVYGLKGLRKELLDSNCMIFRLGSPKGESYTHFALAKTKNGWSDYFLIDENIFKKNHISYDLGMSENIKLLFNFLPSLSETALVNFSLASGVLYEALKIHKDEFKNIIPAVSSGAYTFDFKPLSSSNRVLTHHQGQVEIDSFFLAKRNNKNTLFIVEAKLTNLNKKGRYVSLAKHKLLYPILAMENKISNDIKVVPVYIRFILNKNNSFNINIVECDLPRIAGTFGALDELKPLNSSNYLINLND
tara:strand:- start:54 stop:917 length:864 start_codon:yes stop_codon:yes gene_type:complete